MNKNIIIAMLAVALVLVLLMKECNCKGEKPEVITTEKIDTTIEKHEDSIKVSKPAPAKTVFPNIAKIKDSLRIRDSTVIICDTIGIAILPEELIDSLIGEYYAIRYYDTTVQTDFGSLRKVDTVAENRLWGSAIYPQLEIPTITKTIEHTITQMPSKVSFGLQAGYGYDGSKFRTYIGLGFQWNILWFKKRKQ